MEKNVKIFDSGIFVSRYTQRGGMLIELLLSVGLAAIAIPFLFKYQQRAVVRAENIVTVRQMEQIQTALERYIIENREQLITTIGPNIVRVSVSDLAPFGLSDAVLESGDKYQLRILKSDNKSSQSTLQGVIVMQADNISPLRTREIVSLGGDKMGFIEGNRAYGTFGTWHANTADLGVNLTDGIIKTTSVNRDTVSYLWRVPSDNVADATMQSSFNLAGHDIENANFLNLGNANFDETLKLGVASTTNVIFKNRTTIDKSYKTSTSNISGVLSSDSRTMEVTGTLSIPDISKFSSFTAKDLWVTTLNLSGLSVSSDATIPVLRVNQAIDMIAGRISAITATVGFSGSITPRLGVSGRIEDTVDSNYYWDVSSRTANIVDATLYDLNNMAPVAVKRNGKSTDAYQIFNSVATNKNATVTEYMNAISEIQKKVRAKYQQLNLE